MSDLTAKFTTLEGQLSDEHTETQASLDAINSRLDEFSTTLDTLLANNATNTRYLLAAIGQNSPCAACPTPPILIPPPGETTIPINTEACKRAQAFLAFMQDVFTVLDLASSVGIGFNPSLITDAFNQVISSFGGSDSPNVISFPEAVQLVGDLVNYVALNLTRGATLIASFAPMYFDLRSALYTAGTPGAAKSAYRGVIAGSGIDSDIKAVLSDAAYNDVFSYFFDPASSPDLTGFSGSVCAPVTHDITACTDFDASPGTDSGHSFYYIVGNPMMGPLDLYIGGDYFNWSFQLVDAPSGFGVDIYRTTTGTDGLYTQGHSFPETAQVMSQHTLGICIITHDRDSDAHPFTIRICPPA